MNTGCFICHKHSLGGDAVGMVFDDDRVYAGHILPPDLEDVYLGYLIVEPKRHAAGWGHLTDDEASAIGLLTNDLGRALREVAGAEHIYSRVLGDVVPHLHVHLVPRYPNTPREYWGVDVDDWPDAPSGGVPEIEELCERVRRGLASIRERRIGS